MKRRIHLRWFLGLLVLRLTCFNAVASANIDGELLIAQQLLVQCGQAAAVATNCNSSSVTCACVQASTQQDPDGCGAGAELRIVSIVSARGKNVTSAPPAIPLPDSLGQLGALIVLELPACQLRCDGKKCRVPRCLLVTDVLELVTGH